MSENYGLAASWTNLYREVEALFKGDAQVEVAFEPLGEVKTIKLYVADDAKAEALQRIMPAKRVYGNVTVEIEVIPANPMEANQLDLFETAFAGNPAVSYIRTVKKGLYKLDYVVFNREVVQYFNDDLSDINGFRSTLYQDIAKDLFCEQSGVFFCTDLPMEEDKETVSES